MRKKQRMRRVDFEEVVSDSISNRELGIREKPLNPAVFHIIFSVCVLFAVIFFGRTVFFTGVEGSRYVKRSEANINQSIPLIAPRGIIVDKNGMPLVKNKEIFTVFLQLDEMMRSNEKDLVLNVAANILGLDRKSVAKTLEDTNLDSITDIILLRDITRDQVIKIKTLGTKSLIVESDFERDYTNPAFAHVVGYANLVSQEDLMHNKKLALNDLIGKTGLEAFYDKELRGKNGSIGIYRNAKGDLEDIRRTRDPVAGETLKTTIDGEFQEYFYNRMSEGLKSLGRTSGVGLAINPENGEVLSLMSFPSFDANNISEYLSNPNQPLFNRAISGLYSPGSTIKPIHAVAALSEGVVTPEKQFLSKGFIEIPNPYHPDNPSIFVDWRPQGWVDIHSALARSSNVYFYIVGGGFEETKGLGIDRLRKYWKRFGLNDLTGIDLPGEATGFLPDPIEKEERTGTPWLVGDTYNVSIGQGDLQVTPLELLSGVSAIAEGVAFTPHVVESAPNNIIIDLSQYGQILKEVRIGMEDAVSKDYGTAHLLADLPVKVAAKTGSAQTAGNTKTNALFIGYAPADDPKIAILILVEDAKEGSLNTVPIARDVLEWYYENRLK